MIIFIFFLLLILLNKETFKPNDNKFMICGDLNHHNNNNYKIVNNTISKPLKGFYSSVLNNYHNRDYNKYFNTPICEYKYNFNNDYMNLNRKIDKLDEDDYIKEKIIKGLNNPYENYSKVNDNYSIEYQGEDIKKRFIVAHKKMHNII